MHHPFCLIPCRGRSGGGFHPLATSITPPERLNNPFHYEPHPLCLLAADEVRAYIRNKPEWREEVGLGKMFGVLVVSDDAPAEDALATDRDSHIGYLAAYSGQIGGRSDWEGFVPAVFDYLREDGYFKRHEAEITEMNHEVERLETDGTLRSLTESLTAIRREAGEVVDRHRRLMTEAKRRRDIRRSTEVLSAEEQAAMTRESQFLKAELHRIKKRFTGEIACKEDGIAAFRSRIDTLKRQRRERSDALQRWLFSRFEMLNARGERRNLLDIFAGTAFKVPPAGAGECCEPKLLQYAFTHGLRPLCMAMFWVGDSPHTEIRHDGHFYPACSGKCKPILTWMLEGVRVFNGERREERGERNVLRMEDGSSRMEDGKLGMEDGRLGMENTSIKDRDKSISQSSILNPPSSKPSPILHSQFPILSPLYEDSSLLVVSKPAGLLSVPGRTGGESVYGIVKRHCPGAEGPMIVHRLDMDTSGLLVVAKTKAAHENLQRQFAAHTIKKRYIAVLSVPLKERSGIVTLPIRPDILDRPRQVVDLHGKPATTRYEVIDEPQTPMQQLFARKGAPLVALYPETGRTHQLRIHCAHRDGLNAPIIGDRLYGSKSDRLYLHAEYLEFTHPVTGKRMAFTSEG